MQYDHISKALWPLWASLDYMADSIQCSSPKSSKMMAKKEVENLGSFSQQPTGRLGSNLDILHEVDGSENGSDEEEDE